MFTPPLEIVLIAPNFTRSLDPSYPAFSSPWGEVVVYAIQGATFCSAKKSIPLTRRLPLCAGEIWKVEERSQGKWG